MSSFYIIPYVNQKFKSRLSKNELTKRLKNQISNRSTFKEIIKPTKTSFNGFINIESGHFRLSPKINYRNTSNPDVSGSIEEINNDSGSIINVKINLSIGTYIVFVALLVFISTTLYIFPTLNNFLYLIGFLFIIYLIIIFGFNMGVGETKDAFQKLVREWPKQKSKRQP